MGHTPSLSEVEQYVRAANYLSVIQIFLQDNVLLERSLEFEDIKPRLLGHWGTCPGINLVYGHINRAIKEHSLEALMVIGPGHGFPAVQANLFLEGSLAGVDKKATRTKEGILYISKNFSWPYGFPSHSNPAAPGVILEGGELGYALGTAYGSVLDNPKLVVPCIVGDGEAETGPTATAWHAHRIIDPATSGIVLPILHLNGYKISGPTLMGRMSNGELQKLFEGYGYTVHIIDAELGDLHSTLASAIDASLADGKERQAKAQRKNDFSTIRPSMIVLRTPKGMGGIDVLRGKKITGNHYSHQTVLKEPKTDLLELHALEDWLRSYKFEELFDEKDGFSKGVMNVIPDAGMAMGESKHARGGSAVYSPLELPSPSAFAEEMTHPGVIGSSSMRRAGDFLHDVYIRNADTNNFRMFSPDETYSNKLDKVFEATTRVWAGPLTSFDEDLSQNGRVHEMLSEHTLQAMMQGYVLTGRHALFVSYEAFIQIISSMVDQYAKFLRVAISVPWRGDIPSLNYILTSSGWRQEHNGFSHQNPGFIDDMLQRQGCLVNVYFPADGNTTLAVLHKSLSSKNEINVIVAGKTLEPRWRTPEEAQSDMREGMAIWDFASDEDPHVVVSSVGDYVTKEALAGICLIKELAPAIRMRYVNILTLTALSLGAPECELPVNNFDEYFTKDKPVIVNFHGYPQTIKQILFDYGVSSERFFVNGYVEQGSTTTPFDMHVRNGTSRLHIAKSIAEHAFKQKAIDEVTMGKVHAHCDEVLRRHNKYVRSEGVDLEEIENWAWHHTN
ncbi:MAG: phosphoketolase family protein [bacterium]|nr:phosphoketolase family protein [bacterium]